MLKKGKNNFVAVYIETSKEALNKKVERLAMKNHPAN
jgi:hypothetical protein